MIRVLTHIPSADGDRRFKASAICKKAGISEPSTRKVLQSLVAVGFLAAVRGPEGGYRLTEDPEKITLLNIIKAVDGEGAYDGCILGLPECNATVPCPLHKLWSSAKGELLDQLESTTLKELIDTRDSRVTLKGRGRKRS